MRLTILDHGHGWSHKVLFAAMRTFTRQPVPDAMKLALYRPDFSGKLMGALTQRAMRGPSAWSVGDRELMAAVVAQANQCEFCVRAHGAVAERAYGDPRRVATVLADLEQAPIEEPLRATLRLLAKLTREHAVTTDDMRQVLAAGVSRPQIEEALAVSFAFNVTARLANAFDFFVGGPELFASGARYLLARGYR
jgi:uncharacterized peroxidase-related enzyme